MLSVRECAELLRARGINLAELAPEAFDEPFGATAQGYSYLPEGDAKCGKITPRYETGVHKICAQRTGEQGINRAMFSGFGNIAPVLEDVIAGTSPYAFIEVMACPGGCVGGGGTCRALNGYPPFAEERARALRELSRSYSTSQKGCVFIEK